MVFIFFWGIYDKLKFLLFQIFPGRNRAYNLTMTCAGKENKVIGFHIGIQLETSMN